MKEQDLNPTSAAIKEAFAASYNPEQFQKELAERSLSLEVFYAKPPYHSAPSEFEDGEIVAVHENGMTHPIPAEAKKWAALALNRDPALNAIHDAFGFENGADFSFHLEQENIFLAKPTAPECEQYGLKPGELVAVAGEGRIYPLRAEFEAAEQSLNGKWIEEYQEFYKPQNYDHFMERAGLFDSIAAAEKAQRKAEDAALFREDSEAFYREMYYGDKGVGLDILMEEARKNTAAEMEGGLLVARRMRESRGERQPEAVIDRRQQRMNESERQYSAEQSRDGCEGDRER
jgi:hypothetical protein